MKIQRKDLLYIIMILCLIIVALILRGQLDNSEVVNVISIGSGIASICLAFVSIWFALRQNDESSRWNHKTNESMTLITQEVSKLTNIANELSTLRDEFSYLKRVSEDGFAQLSDIKELVTSQVSRDVINRLSKEEVDITAIEQAVKDEVENSVERVIMSQSQTVVGGDILTDIDFNDEEAKAKFLDVAQKVLTSVVSATDIKPSRGFQGKLKVSFKVDHVAEFTLRRVYSIINSMSGGHVKNTGFVIV